ncbi:50S ribosomal protein L22 [Patescibacteria group bacterium]|nr:50S ribosomal protein L22 [Patescibacteria group bacterium]MBU1966933.1 50S ribosomal protein L22 [Patescibacteria group bacterium]MBU2543719.1 50S ribosomal protein L22 [Patescibacteria group bacterium]
MKITATQKQVRQSPRKMRLVANQIKDLSLEQAMRQLAVMDRRASLAILKVTKQVIAVAMNNHAQAFENLKLHSIEITPGATYKRFRAVSRGRAHSIMKRTSHIKVVLETLDQKDKELGSKKEVAKPKTAIKKKK